MAQARAGPQEGRLGFAKAFLRFVVLAWIGSRNSKIEALSHKIKKTELSMYQRPQTFFLISAKFIVNHVCALDVAAMSKLCY